MDRRSLLACALASGFTPWLFSAAEADGGSHDPPRLPSTESIEERFRRCFADAQVREDYRLKLPPALVLGGRPLIVWAQEVELEGKYKTDGGSLAIIARRILVGPGTTIDTSGLTGQPDHDPSQRARDGRTWGESAASGVRGGDGGNGGDLMLVCRDLEGAPLTVALDGGAGGRGQYGGNGMIGRGGHPGDRARSCSPGGRGGDGGAAGAGGDGGHGGSSGWMFLQTAVEIPAGRIAVTLREGLGGSAGLHGSPGDGGAGGAGSAYREPRDPPRRGREA
jgi:hypothetical protein